MIGVCRKQGYKKRERQVFCGELTDHELFLIEDALVWAKEAKRMNPEAVDALVLKLYLFWEK